MDSFKSLFHRSKEVEPSKAFLKAAKKRLMNRIEQESVAPYFKKETVLEPSITFIQQAKHRLMARIHADKPMMKWRSVFMWFKRATASVLVTVLAATGVLLSVDSGKLVEASQENEIHLIKGEVYIKNGSDVVGDTMSTESAFLGEQELKLHSGDLVRTGPDSLVELHFSGGTRVVLSEKTTLLLVSDLPSSGILEKDIPQENTVTLALSEGLIRVQALNIEQPAVRVTTPQGSLNSINATFDLQVNAEQETEIKVFKNKVSLNFPQMPGQGRTLLSNQKIFVPRQTTALISTQLLTDEDKISEWGQSNQKRDYDYLKELSEQNVERLLRSVGPLPQHLSYSLKLAKENVADLFGDSNEALVQRANIRLNEALAVILNKKVGQETLTEEEQTQVIHLLNEFRNITEQLAQKAKEDGTQEELAQKLLLPSKTLVASLQPALSVDLVEIKDTLNEAEALLAQDTEDPLMLEKVRIENNLERLRDIETFVGLGELEEAEYILAEHQAKQAQATLIALSDDIDLSEKEAFLEEALELKREELALIESIQNKLETQTLSHEELIAMINEVEMESTSTLEEALGITQPVFTTTLPEVTVDPTIQDIVDSVMIYQTFVSKKNVVMNALLFEDKQEDPEFLRSLVEELENQATQATDERVINILKLEIARLAPESKVEIVDEDENNSDQKQEETSEVISEGQTPSSEDPELPEEEKIRTEDESGIEIEAQSSSLEDRTEEAVDVIIDTTNQVIEENPELIEESLDTGQEMLDSFLNVQ